MVRKSMKNKTVTMVFLQFHPKNQRGVDILALLIQLKHHFRIKNTYNFDYKTFQNSTAEYRNIILIQSKAKLNK